ncbi:TIGR04104 family putative zinc finger protein [Clostridium sp. MB05]|uniref:TIGR04104 family putative zinc finger protein n=1 Tax=Clostridium sp. MB05 TaxID=3376682 RepID=UPI0039824BBA
MRNCIECNHKFTFHDRLKSMLNLKGYLKCQQCNSVYKPKPNIYMGIYTGLVVFISIIGFDYVTLSNFKLKLILHIFILILVLSLFYVLPHRWHKYTKIN